MASPKDAGELGMIAFQFPPYFIAKSPKFDYLASLAERLPGASISIEFRHPSWVREKAQRAATMKFLRSHGLYNTSIDAPDERRVKRAFVIFNNCYQNFGIMNASTMAAILRGQAQKAR